MCISIYKSTFFLSSLKTVCEVNLAPAVNRMLSNCDNIIQQHKAACLRVTSLLAHKDIIWVGTSAGVLLSILAQNIGKSTPVVTGEFASWSSQSIFIWTIFPFRHSTRPHRSCALSYIRWNRWYCIDQTNFNFKRVEFRLRADHFGWRWLWRFQNKWNKHHEWSGRTWR